MTDDIFLRIQVTIETTTEETGEYLVDRQDFEQWAGPHDEEQRPRLLKEFLEAGLEKWEVCADVHAKATDSSVVDCEITGVRL